MTTVSSDGSPMPEPRVGVSALILNSEGKILMGVRIGSHGAGTWQFPGGHLDYGEEISHCAVREVEEETGLAVRSLKHVATTNDIFTKEGKHYVTLFMHCELVDPNAEPKIMEPNKCEKWDWLSWDEIVQMVTHGGDQKEDKNNRGEAFLPIRNLVLQKFDGESILKRN
ncbi:NUDIX hydrolase domain-like protein [Xylariales sp. PMI_506]|nr:NUDIX hydrolase domain-like protein [Xylariales sp. PMI_506]